MRIQTFYALTFLSGFMIAWAVQCAFPDVSKIDLAGCTRSCNADAQTCFDVANYEVDRCLEISEPVYQNSCLKAQTKRAEACVNDLVTCVSTCVDVVQQQIGGK